jgi:branched-chain amino acid transport system permease protein
MIRRHPVEILLWLALATLPLWLGLLGGYTALAGTLNAMLFNFTSPQDLHWILSGHFVIMIVLGGMRKFWGPLVGVTIFVVAQDYLSSLTDNWMTLIGLLFVLIVLLFPKGILGLVAPRRRVPAAPHGAPGIQQAAPVLEENRSPLREATK